MNRSLLLVILFLALIALPGATLAAPPAPHQAITEYKGPETCLACHPDAGKEVAQALHYQHQGAHPFLDGVDPNTPAGMMVSY
jgi:hypothetical protein